MTKQIKASNDNTGVKTLCLAFFLILFSFSVFAIDECHPQQYSDEIPCLIFLPTATNCSTFSVSFYNASTLLGSEDMILYSPSLCAANFTYSALGTYTFNYSTGDSGSIVVKEGNKMILLLYFAIVLIIILTILGFYMDNQSILAIDGLLMLIVGFWIMVNGWSIYINLITQMIGTVIMGIGGYFTIMSTIAMIENGTSGED